MHFKERWYLSVLHDQSHNEKPVPSVLSRDKKPLKIQGKKNWNNFPSSKWTLQSKTYSWVQKKYMDISTKIHWHEDGKYPQGTKNQKVIEERNCLTCLKHYVSSYVCLWKIHTIWNTVIVIRWESDQLQDNLNRLLGKGCYCFLYLH